MRHSLKKIGTVVFATVLTVCLQLPAIAATNPFTVSGTRIESEKEEFTLDLKIPEKTSLDAYGVTVTYDPSKLELSGSEGVGYKYSSDFLTAFGTTEGDVLTECNAQTDLGKVIFAGASVAENKADFSGVFASISFKIKDKTMDENKVLSNIKVTVDSLNVKDVIVDVKGMETEYPITISSVKLGDVTGDGNIELEDANMTLKAALKIIKLDTDQTSAADVDGDGTVSLEDANKVLKAALKIITL